MQQHETPTPEPEEMALPIALRWTSNSNDTSNLIDEIATAIRSAEASAYERGRADEREVCAKVADDAYDQATTAIKNAPLARIPALAVKFCQGRQQEAKDIADAIRARSTETGHG